MNAHGFIDIRLEDSLTNICEAVPHAREIARLGPEQLINKESWRFLDRSLERDGHYIGWHIGNLYREGTYGKIYRANRMVVKRREDGLFDVVQSPEEVVIKMTVASATAAIMLLEDVTAHTSEALLHVLAWQTMMKTATPWAIPRPYEVFGDYIPAKSGWANMSLCMSYVRGRTMYSYIQRHWSPTTKNENTQAFFELIAQAAYILHHLQQKLRLNHRDVKVNNILIRKAATPICLELDGLKLTTGFELTLIDFGFACVGCPPPAAAMTVFQAGTWFPMGELCCKAGRDLAQLIFCIHCYFSIDDFLTVEAAALVRSWMQIPWSGGIANALNGFTKEGRPRTKGRGPPDFTTGIYEFLRREDVDPVTCAPAAIFKAIVSLQVLTCDGSR